MLDQSRKPAQPHEPWNLPQPDTEPSGDRLRPLLMSALGRERYYWLEAHLVPRGSPSRSLITMTPEARARWQRMLSGAGDYVIRAVMQTDPEHRGGLKQAHFVYALTVLGCYLKALDGHAPLSAAVALFELLVSNAGPEGTDPALAANVVLDHATSAARLGPHTQEMP